MLSTIIKYRLPLKNCIRGIFPFFSCLYSLLADRPNYFGPLICMVIPTYRCNCRCLYCALGERKNHGMELNRMEIINLAHQIGKTGIQVVHISGGEPLLKTEIFEFIKILKGYSKIIFIDTNGILLEEYLSEIMRSKIDFIGINFESHNPSVCNSLKGYNNAFEKALKGIELIKNKRKGRHPVIDIKGSISELNFKELDLYIEHFKKIGDSITFQPIQDNLIHPSRDRSILFKKENEREFRILFGELVKKYRFLNNNYYKSITDFLFNSKGLLNGKQFRCLLPSSFSLSIQPWGEVALCLGRKDTVIGNIRESRLMDLWRSKKTFKIQRMLRNPESHCICWTANNQQLAQFLIALKLI
jgi:MoaA/NifB/PqqE/SkfB family radical SAM enzyme